MATRWTGSVGNMAEEGNQASSIWAMGVVSAITQPSGVSSTGIWWVPARADTRLETSGRFSSNR